MGRLLTLDYAIEITTEISNALLGPGVVGRCEGLPTGTVAPGSRCGDRMNTWDVARHGCAPCRASTLSAFLVDALQQVRKDQA